jgi:hypothetical protein
VLHVGDLYAVDVKALISGLPVTGPGILPKGVIAD